MAVTASFMSAHIDIDFIAMHCVLSYGMTLNGQVLRNDTNRECTCLETQVWIYMNSSNHHKFANIHEIVRGYDGAGTRTHICITKWLLFRQPGSLISGEA